MVNYNPLLNLPSSDELEELTLIWYWNNCLSYQL